MRTFILKYNVRRILLLAAALICLFTALQLADAQKLTTLYSLKGGADGANPYFVDLVLDAKGNLYGTTFAGGSAGLGVVFRVTSTGTENVLYSFTSADGCSPYTGLIRDAKGNLYGTTGACGAYGFGTVFEVTKAGVEKTLYTFTGEADGGQPFAALLGMPTEISTAQQTLAAFLARTAAALFSRWLRTAPRPCSTPLLAARMGRTQWLP